MMHGKQRHRMITLDHAYHADVLFTPDRGFLTAEGTCGVTTVYETIDRMRS